MLVRLVSFFAGLVSGRIVLEGSFVIILRSKAVNSSTDFDSVLLVLSFVVSVYLLCWLLFFLFISCFVWNFYWIFFLFISCFVWNFYWIFLVERYMFHLLLAIIIIFSNFLWLLYISKAFAVDNFTFFKK